MTDRPDLRLAGRPAPLAAPRGRPISARTIVKEFGTDPETGEQHFSEKWVRENVPGKRRLSHSKVIWYYDEVAEWFATGGRP